MYFIPALCNVTTASTHITEIFWESRRRKENTVLCYIRQAVNKAAEGSGEQIKTTIIFLFI